MRRLSLLFLLLAGCAEEDNSAPSILPVDDLRIRVNTSGRIDVTAADADDDRLSFDMTIEPLPPTVTQGQAGRPTFTKISNNSAVFSWTPGIADAGGQAASDYAVTFVVTDGRGGRATETIQITVENPGVAGSGGLRFTEPSGAGIVVDLNQTPCVNDLEVAVKGDLIANEDVEVTLAQPAPERAILSPDAPGKNKLFNWCPTEEQLDASLSHQVCFVATWDAGDAPVNKCFQIRFRRGPTGGACPGAAPVVEHEPPGAFSGPLNYDIRARIVDDVGFKSPPVLAFFVGEVEGEPDLSGWELVPFSPEQGDTWLASIPNLLLEAGESRVISYVVIATDNDDAGGTRCDHETQSPVFQLTATGGAGGGGQTYGFCAPCVSDAQCGGEGDRCVDLQGQGFCGRSCENADCAEGQQCLIVDSVDGVSSAQCLPADLNCGQLCIDDVLEANGRNDAPEQATAMLPGVHEDLTICGDDLDFFNVPVEAGQSLRVTIRFEHARGDLDLGLGMPGDGVGVYPYLSNGYTDEETVYEACALEGGDAQIVVVGYQQPRNTYTLEIIREAGQCNLACDDDAYDDGVGNDTVDNFVPIEPPFFEQGLTLCPQDVDLYGFEATAGQIIGVAIGFVHAEGDLQLNLYRSSGELVASSAGTLDGEIVEIGVPTDDLYLVEVRGATRSANNRYDMEVQVFELQRCVDTRDCAPETYCNDGVCLDAFCAGFLDCAGGHGCVPPRAGLDPGAAGGMCLADCFDDRDCRAGEACKRFEDFSQRCTPEGVGGVGTRCAGHFDCAGAAACFPVPGGYCAAGGCGADLPCEGDAVCGQLLGFDACLKRCVNDGDCRVAEGYTCRDVGGGERGCGR